MVTVSPLLRRDPLALARLVVRAIRNPVESWARAFYEQPIVTYRAFGRTICFVMDPQAIHTVLHDTDRFSKSPLYQRVLGRPAGQGLLVAEGETWRAQRCLTAPVFNQDALLRYAPAMTMAAERLLARWHETDAGSADISDEMDRLAYEIIQSTVLRASSLLDYDGLNGAISDFMRHVTWRIAYASLGLPRWLPFPHKKRADRAGRYLRLVAGEAVACRREGPATDDLLQTLLDGADRDPSVSTDLIVDNVVTFLMAGYETLAKSLTWTLYLLASSPDWQDRIAREVQDVAGDAFIDREHARGLVLTRQVYQEAMRLYAPAPSLVRFTQEPARLCGVELQRGAIVVVPIFVLHRHRKLWDRPDDFDPARFAHERKADRCDWAFLPFSGGPRGCIGASYSMLAATLVLATLIRGTQFARVEGSAPTPLARVTLHVKGRMPLKIKPRPKNVAVG